MDIRRGKVTEEEKIYNEEFQNFLLSPNIVRMRWVGHVVRMKEGRYVRKILVGKPQ